jgi:hypothetical protein
VGTLTEKDVLAPLGHDALSSGYQAGQLNAGRTAAQSEIRENVARHEGVDPNSAEAALEMGRQERAEVIGATQAASTQRYVDAAEQRTRRSIAEGEQIARDESAERIGTVDAKGADVNALSFERTERAFGREAMVEGAAFNRMTDAARGAEVYDSENPADVARHLAHVDVAERLAHVDVVHSLGKLVGVDTSTDEGARQLAVSKEGANQTVTISAAEEAKERVIEAFALDDHTASALRAHSGGFKLGVAMDETGELAYGSITAGGQTTLVDSTSIERGFSERADYGYSVSGGRALVLEEDYLTRELDKAYGEGLLSGNYDETKVTALAGGIAKYVSESGQSIDATSQETVAHTIGGSLGGGTPSKTPVQGSIRGSTSKQEADVRNARSDLAYEYALETIQEAHKQAVAGYQIDHGALPTNDDREELLTRMASSIQKTMEGVNAQIREETDSAQEGHDVDPFPYNELPPAPMSDPDYANYKSPISKR